MIGRVLIGLVVVSLMACAGDSLTGSEGGVAGTWSVAYTDDATDCDVDEGVTTGTVSYVIAQNGNSLTVTFDDIVFTGTLDGTEATWSATYPEEEGGTEVEQFTVTFANNNTTLSGGSIWDWTDGTDSCSGTSTIAGSKV